MKRNLKLHLLFKKYYQTLFIWIQFKETYSFQRLGVNIQFPNTFPFDTYEFQKKLFSNRWKLHSKLNTWNFEVKFLHELAIFNRHLWVLKVLPDFHWNLESFVMGLLIEKFWDFNRRIFVFLYSGYFRNHNCRNKRSVNYDKRFASWIIFKMITVYWFWYII